MSCKHYHHLTPTFYVSESLKTLLINHNFKLKTFMLCCFFIVTHLNIDPIIDVNDIYFKTKKFSR